MVAIVYVGNAVVDTADELMGIAEIIGDYIKMLYRTNTKEATKHHWLVSVLKQHAEQINSSTPTLRELAINYHKNEKYMGRLLKKEMGITFHQYCLSIRLQKAETLLSEMSDKVIDIAFECGFNNISYFNRTFKAEYGVSPSTYAALKKK